MPFAKAYARKGLESETEFEFEAAAESEIKAEPEADVKPGTAAESNAESALRNRKENKK